MLFDIADEYQPCLALFCNPHQLGELAGGQEACLVDEDGTAGGVLLKAITVEEGRHRRGFGIAVGLHFRRGSCRRRQGDQPSPCGCTMGFVKPGERMSLACASIAY